PEVDALDGTLVLLAEQLAQQPGGTLMRGHQVVVQTLQVPHGVFLGGIMEKVGALQVGLIALEWGHGRLVVGGGGRHFNGALGAWQFAQIVHNGAPQSRLKPLLQTRAGGGKGPGRDPAPSAPDRGRSLCCTGDSSIGPLAQPSAASPAMASRTRSMAASSAAGSAKLGLSAM